MMVEDKRDGLDALWLDFLQDIFIPYKGDVLCLQSQMPLAFPQQQPDGFGRFLGQGRDISPHTISLDPLDTAFFPCMIHPETVD